MQLRHGNQLTAVGQSQLKANPQIESLRVIISDYLSRLNLGTEVDKEESFSHFGGNIPY